MLTLSEIRNTSSAYLKKKWIIFLVYIIVIITSIIIEHSDKFFGGEDCGSLGLAARFWHQRLSTAGHRKPRAHFVRIIYLASETEPIADRCEARRFTTALLYKLKEADPAEIVVDKWYEPGVCDEPTNKGLAAAFDTVSRDIPMVIAQTAESLESLKANHKDDFAKQLQANGFTDNDLLLGENMFTSAKSLHYGLAFPDCDNRRIPLAWPVYDLNKTAQKGLKPAMFRTLPFQAAIIADTQVEKLVSYYTKNQVDAFTSFLQEEAFQPVNARRLCDPHGIWSNCSLLSEWKQTFRGKIVVIGEFSNQDVHDSVLGKTYGSVLLSNYIESLMDDRYFRSLAAPVEVLLTVLCLVVIEVIFGFADKHPFWGLFRSSAFLLFLVAISYLSVMEWGLLLTFWLPSFVAIILRFFDSIKDFAR